MLQLSDLLGHWTIKLILLFVAFERRFEQPRVSFVSGNTNCAGLANRQRMKTRFHRLTLLLYVNRFPPSWSSLGYLLQTP